MTADALPTAQIDGVVWTQVLVGNTVFAGGTFTSVRPAGAAPNTREAARSNLMSYDIRTGVSTAFGPIFNGTVRALAVSADQRTLYVGGEFTTVNRVQRLRFAAFDIASSRLLSISPRLDATVNAIAVLGGTVYIGGYFTVADGLSRSRLAALDATTGQVLSWAPSADYTVRALVATPDKTGIVVGGNFDLLNETPATGMGLLDASTGSSKPWAVNSVVQDSGGGSAILSLAADDSTVYGSGYTLLAGNFEGVFAADPGTGAVKWLQDCHGDTYSVAPIGDIVYSVGHAHYCRNIGGFPDTSPRSFWQHSLAVTREATGTVTKNGQPGSHYGNFEGQPAPSLFNWFPELGIGSVTGQSQAGWSVVGNSDYLAIGGEFPTANGRPQQGLVRFARSGLAPNRQGPQVAGVEMAPTVLLGARSVTLGWQANWDRDDRLLTYEVLRDDVVVKTSSAISHFWSRPALSFVDESGAPDRPYSYSVRVRDPHGNSVTSPTVAVVFPSDASYAQRVRDDGATHQWRLGSPVGSASSVDTIGGLPLSPAPGVTFGAAGALPADADTAALFAGTAQTPVTASPTGRVSVEGWFRTTNSSVGALVGFGSANRATPAGPGSRQIYLNAAGRLAVVQRSTGTATVTAASARSYNDDTWHQLVAVRSANSLQLYVDGSRVASVPSAVSMPPGTGVWFLGGTTPSNQPGASTSAFSGAIDDVAVFAAALTPRQVRDHYLTARPRFAINDTDNRRRRPFRR